MLYEDVIVREVITAAVLGHDKRVQGRFLKGPIPLKQLTLAARLPGQALAAYLAIHHRAALTRLASVTLPKALMTQFGVSRDAKARALRALEEASLVTVERVNGRSARVTLLAATKHGG
jgi:DNA-binding transcriptional ArsR family regulator